MSQPLDRTCTIPAKGPIDEAAGEFWAENPFEMTVRGDNLSAYERNKIYLNLGGESFVDLSFAMGADIDSDSRSVMTADFNRDGATDLLVGSVGGGPLRLFLNRIPDADRCLHVKLVAAESNQSGIGTRVIARIGKRQIVRDVFPHNGFQGQSPPELLLGVGDAVTIDELEVRWPSGKVQRMSEVSARGTLLVDEAKAELPHQPASAKSDG